MGDSIIVVIAVGSGLSCLMLAGWIWKRGRAPTPPITQRDPQDEHGTVVIPKDQLFSSQTVVLDQDAAARAVTSRAPSPDPEPATEYVPREEIFRVADRARAADQGQAAPTGQAPEESPASTEFIPRDELAMLIESSRASQARPAREPEAATNDTPSAAPTPSSASTPSLAPTPPPDRNVANIPVAVLAEQFDASVDALGRILRRDVGIAALVDGPLREWRASLELLVLGGERTASELLLPTLDDARAPELRRVDAALVLLHMRDFDGHSAVLERAQNADQTTTQAIITAIEYSDSARVDALLGKALAAAREVDKPRWWSVFATRAQDPGGELVSELLTSKDPTHVKIGLELLCVHAGRAAHGGTVDRLAFSSDKELKTSAIVAGLVLGRASASVVCKQAARDPECADACLLHAALASDKELASLIDWATSKDAPAHAAWALGYSGRVSGIEACLALFDGANEDVVARAIAGFRAATGFAGERHEAKSWWAENRARFHEATRYLLGRPADVEGTRLALREADPHLWRCCRLELLVRGKGEVRIPAVGMPDQLLAAIDAIELGLG